MLIIIRLFFHSCKGSIPRLPLQKCYTQIIMKNYPLTAILGQDEMKEALILNLINPKLGDVLIRGQRGTAKSTAVGLLRTSA